MNNLGLRMFLFAQLIVMMICVPGLTQFPTEQEKSKFGRKGQWRFKDKASFKKDAESAGETKLPAEIKPAETPIPKPVPAEPEPVKPIVEKKLPTVYRYGKLPTSLPSWFEEYDEDEDGQVGYYEWKSVGNDMKEFLLFDLNKDGFLSAEEFIRYLQLRRNPKPKAEIIKPERKREKDSQGG